MLFINLQCSLNCQDYNLLDEKEEKVAEELDNYLAWGIGDEILNQSSNPSLICLYWIFDLWPRPY